MIIGKIKEFEVNENTFCEGFKSCDSVVGYGNGFDGGNLEPWQGFKRINVRICDNDAVNICKVYVWDVFEYGVLNGWRGILGWRDFFLPEKGVDFPFLDVQIKLKIEIQVKLYCRGQAGQYVINLFER